MATATESLKRFFSNIAIFGGLEERTLERVVELLEAQRAPKGTVICREGEPGRAMYVLAEGEVMVCREGTHGNRIRMVRLGSGEFFGEMTLIDPQPRSATVTVEKDSTLYALTNRDLYRLYQEDLPGYAMVVQNLCRELARRLRRADERICEMVDRGLDEDQDITQIRASPFARRVRKR